MPVVGPDPILAEALERLGELRHSIGVEHRPAASDNHSRVPTVRCCERDIDRVALMRVADSVLNDVVDDPPQ